jgi:hypothetical protein
MARLSKETQLHLDERDRHFQITDLLTMGISIMLALLAVINIYYVSVLYRDLGGIVTNIDSMHRHLVRVNQDMEGITLNVAHFDDHLEAMTDIHKHMGRIANIMPNISKNMGGIRGNIERIEQDMAMLSNAMVMRSPVESSISISRLGGEVDISRLLATSSSVVFPIAETTIRVLLCPTSFKTFTTFLTP